MGVVFAWIAAVLFWTGIAAAGLLVVGVLGMEVARLVRDWPAPDDLEDQPADEHVEDFEQWARELGEASDV